MSKICSLNEYIQKVEGIYESWGATKTLLYPWFRGQADASWKLVPGFYRSGGHVERQMVRDFRLRAPAFLEEAPARDIEWLFIMQHYGMPTRLLDWTESHLAALYFAVSDYTIDKDAAVWAIFPWTLNDNTIGIYSVPTSEDPVFKQYVLRSTTRFSSEEVEAEFPAALRPVRTTSRIVAQRGMFTIHGNQNKDLKQIIDDVNASTNKSEVNLEKLTIDGQSKRKILKQLFLAGISHSLLFPDLDGLSKEISFRYSGEHISIDIN